MPYKDKTNRTCGFIDVEEKEKSGKFVRRYLRLDRSRGVVEWFADSPANLPKNSKPHGTIDVNFITKVDVAAKVKFKAKHCFVVNIPMRRYYFQGNDEADMVEWVETLNNASKIVVSDDEPDNSCWIANCGEVQSSEPTEEYSYKTEIVAGVVVQRKMETDEEFTELKSDDTRSLMSFSNGSPKYKRPGSPAKAIKQGWAVKQGHLRKNWKRRFFLLSTAGFSYFKSDHDKEPIRFIPMSDILASKQDQTMLSQYKDNLFLVATTERIYYIQADSPKEMKNWIKCFHDAIRLSSSLKLKSKGDKFREPADKDCATPTKAATAARKLEVSLSVASPQRNSAFLGKPNAHRGFSPIASYRLSSADETSYRPLVPYQSMNNVKIEQSRGQSRLASSSEESGGLGSSVDSITTSIADTNVAKKSPKKKKVFRRSCSGTEILSNETKPKLPPSTEQSKGRHSFPLVESFRVDTLDAKIPSSASFSVSTENTNQFSGSFSSKQSVKPPRSFYLDPKVDHRAAVKPSTVKKKRNTGILFSLNNMLNKKVEKMSSAERKRSGL